MLDRRGDEVAVATSFVRYAPRSSFPAHEHALGEEFIVLEGEFGDEHGRYGPGSYVRNPPGSAHTPFSDPGCVIWVKLRQFDPADRRQCVLALDSPLPEEGVRARELHRHRDEVVRELVAAKGARVEIEPAGVAQEILVLDGEVAVEDGRFQRWSWIRLPAGEGVTLEAREACRLFSKTRPEFQP